MNITDLWGHHRRRGAISLTEFSRVSAGHENGRGRDFYVRHGLNINPARPSLFPGVSSYGQPAARDDDMDVKRKGIVIERSI